MLIRKWICAVALTFVFLATDLRGQEKEISFERWDATLLEHALLATIDSSARLLSSEDGNYLAQDQQELQTYYDLAMSYKYIDSPEVRKQLQLELGQGLIIKSCSEDGEGYKLGFRPSDLVLKIDQDSVATQYDFVIALAERRGKQAEALIRRDGKDRRFRIKLSVQVKQRLRWIIGVSSEELSELLRFHLSIEGVVITAVTENGPSEKMGLKINDIVTKIGDREIANMGQLREAVQVSEGNTLTLELIRAGNKMTVDVTPVEHEIETWRYRSRYMKRLAEVPSTGSFSPTDFSLHQYLATRIQAASDLRTDAKHEDILKEIQEQLKDLQKQVESLKDR